MSSPKHSKNSDSKKIIRAVAPGSSRATSGTDARARSEKRIIVNANSSRMSQQIDIQRQAAEFAASKPDEPLPEPKVTEVTERSQLGKVLTYTGIGFLLLIGIGVVASKTKEKPPPLMQPAVPISSTSTKIEAPPPTIPKKETVPPLERGLLAHWPFDGDLNDATQNHTTTKTEKAPQFAEGRVGQALVLDGTDPVTIMPLSKEIKEIGTSYSICTWNKLPARVKQKPYASFLARGVASYRITLQSTGSETFRATLGKSKVDGTAQMRAPEHKFPVETWHHLCVVRDGNRSLFYVNGKLIKTAEDIAPQIDHRSNVPLVIGGSSAYRTGANHRNLIGLVDDVRFYNRALDAEEVQQLVGME